MGLFQSTPLSYIILERKVENIQEAETYLLRKPNLKRQTCDQQQSDIPSDYAPDIYQQAIVFFNEKFEAKTNYH